MNLHGQNFIGDQLRRGLEEAFYAASPLDRKQLEPAFHTASEKEVNAAMELAKAAFDGFCEITNEERAVFLERIADEIMALGHDLIEQAHLETGLPETRLTGERARTANQLKLFAQLVREGSWVDARIDTAIPDRQPVPKPDLRRMLIPIGPVIVFGASNFPFAYSVAGGDTASALAAGNPVVVKAHERHPGTSELTAVAIRRAVEACHLPAGVFSMLHGLGKTVGMALVRHPFARAVGFTGSRVAGRALFDAAAARPDPIPVFAEMSSLNPVFILPEALRACGAKIAEGLKNSVTLGAGQFCTKPGLVFGLQGAEFERFQQSLGQLLKTVAPTTMLHEGIHDAYRKGLIRVSEIGGVELLAHSDKEPDAGKTQGESVLMYADAKTFRDHPELAGEVFGPFSILIAAPDISELEEVAQNLEGQLTATVHGTSGDFQKAEKLLRRLERKAGRLILNGFPTGVEVCPAMNHGGPYPATTDVRFTSVGTAAIYRFARPVCYQDFLPSLLPMALRNENPLGIQRIVNGKLTTDAIGT
ncbi:MAG TPA: aldehyde dehydrogenase (NADP(+)) [Candidatus Saccharimonadales bacterium]|nr:aldehyde dehydrogenase (NADP(+)) [Candidatus Saccharimonadales bacterium]